MRSRWWRCASVGLLMLGACEVQEAAGPPPPPPPLPAPPPLPPVAQPHPPPEPEVQRPMVQVGRVRVPQHANLERPVVFRGRQMTLREATMQVDPNEPVRLRNGRQVPTQQLIDAMDAWEKRSNVRLSHIMKRLPVPAQTQTRVQGVRQQLSAELQQRRDLAANQWRAIIDRPGGAGKRFAPSMARFPDGRPVTGGISVSMPGRPRPSKEPFDDVWSPAPWGDPSDLAAYINASFGDEFKYDDKGAPGTGCAAQLDLGGYLLGYNVDVVKFTAGADATERDVRGAARLYLLGLAQPAWEAKGALKLPIQLPYRSSKVHVPIATLEPVTLYADADAFGATGIDASVQPHTTPGREVGCDLVITPNTWAKAEAGAVLQPMEGLNEVLEVVVGSLSAGVDCDVTIFQFGLPIDLGLALQLQPGTGAPMDLDQRASVDFTANLLAGKLTAFIELDANEFVAWLFDLDSPERWEWDLHEWPGEQQKIAVVGPVHYPIPFTR